MRSFVVLVCMGCATATPPAVPEPVPAPTITNFEIAPLERDVSLATSTLDQIGAHVRSLPAEERDKVRSAARELATNCPYTRATYMVPLALEAELAALDVEAMSPATRTRIAQVQRGVTAHADVVRAIGAAELPMPTPNDFLGTVLFYVVDGKFLADDPLKVEHTRQALAIAPDIAALMSTDYGLRIDEAHAELEPHYGHRLVTLAASKAWKTALSEIDRESLPADDAARLDGIDRMLQGLLDSRC